MQKIRKILFISLQVFLSGVTAIFLTFYPFSTLIHSWLPLGAESFLCIAGIVCTAAAILLLMVYASHEAKGMTASLPFIAACKHAGHMVLFLLCLLPALLLFSILEGLYFWLVFPYFFNTGSSTPSPLGLILSAIPALATLLPLALHPFFFMLIHPRPIRETFRHARQTWKVMYKSLLFWCIAIIALQTAVSWVSNTMPHGFSEIIPIISSTILQTAFFYKMLARYAHAESAVQT